MTYDRLLALDASVAPRRLTVASASQATTPEALFKSLRTTTYRSKKKKKLKKKTKLGKGNNGSNEYKEQEEVEAEEDECAICLCEFEHRQSGKMWPCGHFFHAVCTRELLKHDTRCPLCRFCLVKKTHG